MIPLTVGEEKLDEATLREVARGAGGSYFFAADREQLAGIYEELDRIETREVKVISHRPRRDLFYWPLLAALLLSLVGKGDVVLQHRRGVAPLQSAQDRFVSSRSPANWRWRHDELMANFHFIRPAGCCWRRSPSRCGGSGSAAPIRCAAGASRWIRNC